MKILHAIALSALTASLCTVLATHFLAGTRGNAQDAELDRRLQALESAAGRAQPSTSIPSFHSPAPAHPATSIGNTREGSGGEAETQARADALMRGYANRFKAEPVSAVWAKNTEIAVLEALTSDEAKAAGIALPSDVEVQCKSTLCSINASYSDDGEAGDAATILAMDISHALPRMQRRTIYKPDGSVELQIYAMK